MLTHGTLLTRLHAPPPGPFYARHRRGKPRPRNSEVSRRGAADKLTTCSAAHHGLRRRGRLRIPCRDFRVPRLLIEGCPIEERRDARSTARYAEPAPADLAQRTRGGGVPSPLQARRFLRLDVHDAWGRWRVRNSGSAWAQQTRPGRYAAPRKYAKSHDEVGVLEEKVERFRLAEQHRQNIFSLCK